MKSVIAVVTFAFLTLGLSVQASADPYSEQVKKEFMTGCTAQAPTQHCECVLAKLETSVTEAELIEGKVEDKVIDNYVNQCLAEVTFEGEWPEEIRTAFMDGCTSEATRGQCSCVMSKLQDTVPFNDVINQKIPEEKMNEFVEACRDAGGAE